ncbi:MAG: YggS family pyridoxal phosphate-dependent enzyme [Gammaproteobacteria bacterium]|nr:YggS family pyridoxal phosphate-dependent enzyme [Gammaproteobacteria bacterium]
MTIDERFKTIRQHIEDATKSARRDSNSVTLLAVSKAQEINKIEQAYQLGQKAFGESYLSEALPKIEALSHSDIDWHFIGPIQSNKTKDIAENFDWVQSVDRIKIARRLNEQRPTKLGKLNVLVQVDLFEESTKQGCQLKDLDELLDFVVQQPNLHLRGLMAIPPRQSNTQQQLDQFSQIALVFENVKKTYPEVDVLSMGMSDDMTSAIAAGSNMVRIGSALFGERPANWKSKLK